MTPVLCLLNSSCLLTFRGRGGWVGGVLMLKAYCLLETWSKKKMVSWNSSSYVQVYEYILLISLFWTEKWLFCLPLYRIFFTGIHLESLLNLDFDPTIKVDIKQPSRKRLNYLEVFFCCPNNFNLISISYPFFFLFLGPSFFYCQKSSEFLVLGIIRTRNRLRNAVLKYIKLPCYTKTHGKHSSLHWKANVFKFDGYLQKPKIFTKK